MRAASGARRLALAGGRRCSDAAFPLNPIPPNYLPAYHRNRRPRCRQIRRRHCQRVRFYYRQIGRLPRRDAPPAGVYPQRRSNRRHSEAAQGCAAVGPPRHRRRDCRPGVWLNHGGVGTEGQRDAHCRQRAGRVQVGPQFRRHGGPVAFPS